LHSRSLSNYLYFTLVISLAILGGIGVFLPQGAVSTGLPEGELPASKPVIALVTVGMMLFLYGGLGFLGLVLSRKLGFADVWDAQVSTRQRLLIPGLTGAGLGVFFILADLIFSGFQPYGRLPHPPFPTSLVASATAGIGEEMIFRLFFIPLWVWVMSYLLLRRRGQEAIFWIVSIISALAFAAGHLPSVMFLLGAGTVSDLSPVLLVEIFLLNGVLSLFAAYSLRKAGFLAAVSIHFWADIVWHVVWGLVSV
jgi:hypothetical protein